MADRLKKVQKALRKKDLGGIECTEVRNCIRLEGEMDSWTDIVKAGKTAAKFGYKGVLNDISLKGFDEPAIRAPKTTDSSLEGVEPDVMIIGGGVIGCSIARELTKYQLNVLLVDKESDVAMQASSRNDGMIHPGIASHPGTLRGEMNVRGNAMYTQICKDLSIPFERWSNLILYSERFFGFASSFVLAEREKKLGIEGHKVSLEKLHEIEPNITDKAIGAFEFPSSGVLSPYKLTVAFAENAVENGAKVSLDTIVTGMTVEGGKITAVKTNRGTVRPKAVINAAGTFSDKIAEMADDRFFTIHPRKGHLAILDKKQGPLVQRSMGLIGLSQAFSDTKGGGVMRTIDGNVLVGPDAFEQPYREDFSTKRENVDAMLNKHLPLIKGFSKADVITYFAGVRAATYEEEFIVEGSERVENLIHAAGIQSPGLASAPAIAEDITKITVDRLSKVMEVKKNDSFNPRRRVTPVMAKLSLEEKQAAIAANPDYGIVVCRCEGISRGEIIDAINSPVPATSIDAIKRRVRPGMGRCQGGFCMPLVTGIICEQTGMKPSEVTKSGEGSELLFEKEEVNTNA
ncbi:MAG: NAD(P)/FAD-dependent oxidoreductase [Oscillospiraceae bacterium]|nr:NAD(P)/FAD-dependent oxidoreductase [Oscillospiraceae bacterium]